MQFGYDIECFPNVFTVTIMNVDDPTMWWQFEFSDRKNQLSDLVMLLHWMGQNGYELIGFNNQGYDYPMLHYVMLYWSQVTPHDLYAKSYDIIHTDYDKKWIHVIWDKDCFVKQIDLLKINGFDNIAKATSLKILEFNMKSDTIQDLPFEPETYLAPSEIDELLLYNKKDVVETIKFFHHCKAKVDFRKELTTKTGISYINKSNASIGETHLISELEKASPGCCFIRSGKKRIKQQTFREFINLGEVILPFISFEEPELIKVHERLKNTTITETKGSLKDVTPVVNGFKFVIATGGLHGCIDSCTVVAKDGYVIKDKDVTSYYPSTAIANNFFPEHLGLPFCGIYAGIRTQRVGYPKGTPENGMLKESLNAAYGKSNSVHSCFLDPKFTMSITINGQLQLCMLAEQLMKTPTLTLIQANTDGVTYKVHEDYVEHTERVCDWWMSLTGLELEEANYSRMFIRDVNNYIAEYTSGKLKLKGAYEIDRDWHKNHSNLIVPKAAKAHLIHGADIKTFIECHPDPFDFMARTKIPRGSKLAYGIRQRKEHEINPATGRKRQKIVTDTSNVEYLQRVTRYYISTDGEALTKIMPPTDKMKKEGNHNDRYMGIDVGWTTSICNDMKNFKWDNLNYDYYIKETHKLVDKIVAREV